MSMHHTLARQCSDKLECKYLLLGYLSFSRSHHSILLVGWGARAHNCAARHSSGLKVELVPVLPRMECDSDPGRLERADHQEWRQWRSWIHHRRKCEIGEKVKTVDQLIQVFHNRLLWWCWTDPFYDCCTIRHGLFCLLCLAGTFQEVWLKFPVCKTITAIPYIHMHYIYIYIYIWFRFIIAVTNVEHLVDMFCIFCILLFV